MPGVVVKEYRGFKSGKTHLCREWGSWEVLGITVLLSSCSVVPNGL